MEYTSIKSTKQRFYIKGRNSELLITSGIHGDEFELVPLVEKAVEKYHDALPDFLYIPEASPSALSLKTRRGDKGLDFNRSFFKDTPNLEVREFMKLCKSYRFDLYVEFHEDPDNKDKFYLYDGMTANYRKKLQLKGTRQLELLYEDLINLGLELYSGIDDPNDPDMGYQVENGYAFWPMTHDDHSSDFWLLADTGIAKQVICPEIPGKSSIEKKQTIVEAIFRRILLKI